MKRVKFYLKDKNKKQETLIYMRYRLDGKTFKYSVSMKIHPSLWDSTACRPTKSKATIRKFKAKKPMIETHLSNLTHRLNQIEGAITVSYTHLTLPTICSV